MEPTSLNEVLAHKTGDARKWTPIDMVRKLLRDLESGELDPEMIYVCMKTKPAEDGLSDFPAAVAGCTKIEAIGLLYTHLHICTD